MSLLRSANLPHRRIEPLTTWLVLLGKLLLLHIPLRALSALLHILNGFAFDALSC